MDAGKAALMQMQIKHNAEDLQDYLKGLDNWEEEIKAKDVDLSRQKPILKESFPPVRSQRPTDQKRKKKKKKKAKIVPAKPDASRISSYDYRSWDKFDVEKACEEVDYQVQSSSSYESSSDEEVAEAQRRQQAVMEKEKGNEYFKRGKYELAVECYAKAMELDPDSAVMPANRALALLKLERYAAAEVDCSLALELDSTYVKAFLRRATARGKLKNLVGARQDYESVLKIEPGNKLAISELEKLDKELGTSGMRYLRAVKRPPHLRSKKPLKRIIIEQIEATTNSQTVPETLQNGQNSTTTAQLSSEPESGHKSTTTARTDLSGIVARASPVEPPGDGQNTTPSQAHSKTGVKIEVIEKVSNIQPTTSQGEGGRLSETSDSRSVVSEPQAAPNSVSKESSSALGTKMAVSELEAGEPRGQVVEAESGRGLQKMPPVPSSSIQFQADWKRLRRDRKMLSQYFKAIPTSQYPSLLQQSLETDVFHDIVSILHQDFVKSGVVCVDHLAALTKVKRFSVAVVFLSKLQKQGLVTLFEDLLDLVKSEEDRLKTQHLAKQFSVSVSCT